MKILGITGGIGSGKTTIAKHIESLGVPVYYSDDRAKVIVDIYQDEIAAEFGSDIIVNGRIDRKILASKVFSNTERLQKINSIVHPKVAEDFKAWVEFQNTTLVAKEAAILFESGGDKLCDFILLITAPIEVRLERVIKRDNTNKDSVLKRMEAQLSDKYKAELSDFIIENIDVEKAKTQATEIINKIYYSFT